MYQTSSKQNVYQLKYFQYKLMFPCNESNNRTGSMEQTTNSIIAKMQKLKSHRFYLLMDL